MTLALPLKQSGLPIPEATVLYVNVKDSTICWQRNNPSIDILNLIEKKWGLERREGEFETTIPAEEAEYDDKVRSVACCGFDSANSYIKCILGGSLSSADLNYYKRNEKVIEGGLIEIYTLDTIQDLVSVYGIGISEVFFPKGTSLEPALSKWLDFLPTNPMGKLDRVTSNEEFYKQIEGLGIEQSYKVDFVDNPPSPTIICNYYNYKGLTGSSFLGGHASFLSPREKNFGKNWAVAFRLDRLSNINYLQTPVLTPYVEADCRVLNLEKSLGYEIKTTNFINYSEKKKVRKYSTDFSPFEPNYIYPNYNPRFDKEINTSSVYTVSKFDAATDFENIEPEDNKKLKNSKAFSKKEDSIDEELLEFFNSDVELLNFKKSYLDEYFNSKKRLPLSLKELKRFLEKEVLWQGQYDYKKIFLYFRNIVASYLGDFNLTAEGFFNLLDDAKNLDFLDEIELAILNSIKEVGLNFSFNLTEVVKLVYYVTYDSEGMMLESCLDIIIPNLIEEFYTSNFIGDYYNNFKQKENT